MEMTLSSPAFPAGATMPARFAMRAVPSGQNVSVPYAWSGAPASTKSFALALVDRSPVAHDWVHWLVVDIPAGDTSLPEGASMGSAMPVGARELDGSFGFAGYGGPQPPPGTGQHPYEATVYALDVASLGVSPRASLAEFERAIAGHVLARGTYTGTFGR